MPRFLKSLIPFFFIGIAIVVLTVGMIVLAYLIAFGALVGLGLYLVARIRQYFSPVNTVTPTKKNQSGRIIDSDDWKEL